MSDENTGTGFTVHYDTETTGLPAWKEPSGGESQPHIVQIAAVLVEDATLSIIQKIDLIIKPENWAIPSETIEVHGITNAHANSVGVNEKLAFELFIDFCGSHSRVSYNRTFDQRIIRIAAKRYASDEVIDVWADKENHFCSMQMARKVIGGKRLKLVDAYKHFTGNELNGAHTAMADAMASMQVYQAAKLALSQ